MAHFFNDPSADIILRSSDNVPFKLHKIILTLASDFFRDLLSLPQPPQSVSVPDGAASGGEQPSLVVQPNVVEPNGDGLPEVHVSEPSAVLATLLRLCYPFDDPALDSIDEVRPVLAAALKYDMPKAVQIASRRLRELAPSAPLRAYAIACTLSLEKEARVAAKEVRDQKLQESYVGELEELSMAAYQRLLYYCQAQDGNSEGLRFCEAPAGPLGGHNKKKKKNRGAQGTERAVGSSASSAQPGDAAIPSPTELPSLEGADIVIETIDSLPRRVHRHIIQHASPVLYAMIQNAPSTSQPISLFMTEPSNVVTILFQICSPVEEPSVNNLLDIYAALVAAKKYQMQKAVGYLTRALAAKIHASASLQDTITSYAVACSLGLMDLAQVAAQRTLRKDPTNQLIYRLHLIDVSAGHLYRLLDYHRRCRAAVRAIFANQDWIPPHWKTKLRSHGRYPASYASGELPCWYNLYMEAIAVDPWPSRASALQEDAINQGLNPSQNGNAAAYRTTCSDCLARVGAALLFAFAQYVADTIDTLESAISLLQTPVA